MTVKKGIGNHEKKNPGISMKIPTATHNANSLVDLVQGEKLEDRLHSYVSLTANLSAKYYEMAKEEKNMEVAKYLEVRAGILAEVIQDLEKLLSI
jgi:hypothetical protein